MTSSKKPEPLHPHHQRRSHRFEIVVIASSMGGIQALITILSKLPANFPVPVVIVQHLSPYHVSQLDEVLGMKTALAVKFVRQKETLKPGTVYIAPPDKHLIFESADHLSLTDHRKIRHVRPAANPLFESAAEFLGKGVIGVVLMGGDYDATDGVQSIHKAGGVVLAQNEATSEAFSMPESAIKTGCVDLVLPITKIADAIIDLVYTGSYE